MSEPPPAIPDPASILDRHLSEPATLACQRIVSLNGKTPLYWVEYLSRPAPPMQPEGLWAMASDASVTTKLDMHVIKRALGHLAGSPEIERGAINVSARSISDKFFLDDVVEVLSLSGVAPQRLCFEITETEPITDLRQAQVFCRTAQQLGAAIALDDLTPTSRTGRYVGELPADIGKLDGSLVRTAVAMQGATGTIAEWVGRCRNAGLVTVAEAVESHPHFVLAKRVACDYAQGFYTGTPQFVA